MYEYNCEVERVIDGDTVVLTIDLGIWTQVIHEHVRLLGINAPELRSSDPSVRIDAKASKQFLIDQLDGQVVTVKTEKDKSGKYGRLLGTLFVGDKNINELMVSAGYAVYQKY